MKAKSDKYDILKESIKQIPTGSTSADLQNLLEMTNYPDSYDLILEYLPKLDLNYYDPDLLEQLCSALLTIHPDNRPIIDLFNFFSVTMSRVLLIELMIRNPNNAIAFIPYFSAKLKQNQDDFTSLASDAVIAISKENPILEHARSLRQFLFHSSITIKNHQLCIEIIKSISISNTRADFYEFASYVTSLIRISADNEPIAKELFLYLMNASPLFFDETGLAYESWIISTAASFAPLLCGKIIHPAILDYTHFFTTYITNNQEYYSSIRADTTVRKSIQKRLNVSSKNLSKLISLFAEKSKPIYNKSLPLNSAPPLLRPYHLFQLWHLDLYQLCKSENRIQYSSEDIYNSLINLIRTFPNSAGRQSKDLPSYQRVLFEFLSELPIDISLPFYYLLAQKGYEDEFSSVLARGLKECLSSHNNKLLKNILKILEKVAGHSPALLKPHFETIGRLNISECCTLISILIKGNILSFSKVWPLVKTLPFSISQTVVREGILQIQQRSRSFENAQFILNSLRHYFAKPSSPEINWSAVAEAFPDDLDISATILLNDSNDQGQNSKETPTPLLQWREQFMKYVSQSPGAYHRISAVPYLLLCTGDNEMPKENMKWALSLLPTYQNQAEAIFEGYVIFELSRHILAQNASSEQSLSLLKEIFGYEKTTISKYIETFVHAAVTITIGKKDSLNTLIKTIDSKHLILSSSAKLSINILRTNGFLFEPEHKDIVEKYKNTLVDRIVGLLSNRHMNGSELCESIKESDQRFIDLLLKAHNMNVDSMKTALNQTSFSQFSDIRNHFLLLSISFFLLLPSRSVAESSVQKCMSLLLSPSSQSEQKNFALLALAQVHSFSDDITATLNKFVDNKELQKSLAFFAAKHNNAELLSRLLTESDDYTILNHLKPILSFMDQNILLNYVKKTSEKATLKDLFSSVSFYQNPTILNVLFETIRKRSLIELIQSGQYQNLRTAIAKYKNPENIEKYIYTPFDDFALLAMIESETSMVSIIRGLAGDNCQVTLPVLFLLLLKQKTKMAEFVDSMFSYIQSAEKTEIVKVLKYISLFYLVGANSEPFETIRYHFETNPKELTEELLFSILPSLLTRNITNSRHVDILINAQVEDNQYLDESIRSLRLRHLE